MRKILTALSLSALAFATLNAAEPTIKQSVNKESSFAMKHNYNTAGHVNQLVKFIADQLSANKDLKNIDQSTIAIASFVNMQNLKQTNKLGNLLSENLMHDMQVRGFRVIDFKMMPSLKVGKKGDYIFSRNTAQLAKNLSINYVLTGTYTNFKDGCSINARLIDLKSKIVVSTAQAFVPKATLQSILVDSEQAIYDRVEYKTKYVVPDVEPYIVDINAVDDAN
jgi:TolB-like protein